MVDQHILLDGYISQREERGESIPPKVYIVV